MNTKELSELADRLELQTSFQPTDCQDLDEAARQLRHMAELEAKDAVLEEQRKWCSSKRTEAPTPYHMNYNLVELRAELVKRDSQLAATHQKIQEWWWRLDLDNPGGWVPDAIRRDMESFMRERGVKLERPK